MNYYDVLLAKKLNGGGGGGGEITPQIKTALLGCFSKVAWVDEHGQDYYNTLQSALYQTASLSSITATYTQSGTVYDTDSLDSLKTDLVVTANWSDSSTSTVDSNYYTLSGTLTEGTSTITVTYLEKTTTFSVSVTHSAVPSGYTAYDYIKMNVQSGSSIKNMGIKTGLRMSPAYTYEISVFYPTQASQTEATCLLGTRNGQSGAKRLGLFVKPSVNQLGYWFAGTDTAETITTLVPDSINRISIMPVGKSTTYPNNAVIKLNNIEYSTQSTVSSETWETWFGLMQYQISSSALNGYDAWSSQLEIGEIVIKDSNNDVIYDFIPCNNGTYNGFYESVNGQFYYDESYHTKYVCGNWD